MRVLRRHIASTVFASIMLVLLLILALNLLVLVADGIGEIEGQYTLAKVFRYVSWRIPGMIVVNTGFAALIGCLMGLGMLAANNELTVMRASGVSLLEIVWLVMRPVLLVIVLGMALGEISPHTERYAQVYRSVNLAAAKSHAPIGKKQQLRSDDHLMPGQGVWDREGNEFIHIGNALPGGKIYGLTRYSFNGDKSLAWIQHSEEVTYENEQWLLEDVTTRYMDGSFRETHQQTAYWRTQFTPSMVNFLATEPENLTLHELRHYKQFLAEQQRDSRPYELEWWKKLMKPLEIFSLVAIAVSFVFGPLRQVTMGQRVFIGVMVGVAFQTLQNIFGASSLVFGFSPVLAVLFPITVCIMMGLVVLWRVR